MATKDAPRRQLVLKRRFEAMGLECEVLAGGQTVRVTLPLGDEPFATPEGPRKIPAVRFVTVGHDRIKCVAPRAMFYLPFVRIVECASAADLEARIRASWSGRWQALCRARSWLEGLGIEPHSPAATPQWTFPLGLEDETACGSVVEVGRVVLPSSGPLSGVALASPEERVFATDAHLTAGAELQLAVTLRLESLARGARRRSGPRAPLRLEPKPVPKTPRPTPLLLVGPHLARDAGFHESLRLRGFEVCGVNSIDAAVDAFRKRSFDLVLAETRLDRADGVELIPALRELPGIGTIPVALIDDSPRESRRAQAKEAGASAYMAGNFHAARLAPALARLAAAPRGRRFLRYPQALAVSGPGCMESAVTASIGRGGLFLRTHDRPTDGLFSIHIPETGRTLPVESEVLYELASVGTGPLGVGLRFCAFGGKDEAALIEYLASLKTHGRAEPPSGSAR